jgi:lipopolysaccharide/colanic/teichoic acid biosynthesis glycosyltransferase
MECASRLATEELRIDLNYLRTATVWSDLGVIVKTAMAIFKRGDQ